jgi:hypothetical protein
VHTLFTAEDAEQLRLWVARTEDHVPGTSEKRTLFYAVLASLSNNFSVARPGEGTSGNVLVRGPAIPYYAPPSSDDANSGNGNKGWSKSHAPNFDYGREIRESKEQAIIQLMRRLEEMTHSLLKESELEVWECSDWKYGEPRGAVGVTSNSRTASVKSGRGNWFSK